MAECGNGLSFPNIKKVISSLTRPLVLVVIAGIGLRLILSPLFTMGYDVQYWATVVSNFESGNGLYGLDGYYYTPVWGYILGVVSLLQDQVFAVAEFGARLTAALPVEFVGLLKSSANVPSVGFSVTLKIVLFVADVITGYIIYWILKDRTEDSRKATIGFAMWFLFPPLIMVSSVRGMFDPFSVMFLIASVALIYKDRCFLGGALFAVSVLTKFFPMFFFLVLLIYIIKKHKEDGLAVSKAIQLVAGAILAMAILLLPQILDGTLAYSFSFLTTRASDGMGTPLGAIDRYGTLLSYVAISVIIAYIALRMYKNRDNSFESFNKYLMLTAAATMLYPPVPQYILIIVPFLITWILICDRRYILSWKILAVGSTLFSVSPAMMLTFASLVGGVGWVTSVTVLYSTPGFLGLSLDAVMYCTFGALNYLGVLSLYYLYLRDMRKRSHGEIGALKD